ncbi:hypothetical protein [Cryobacterium sp. Y11]|uniref:hypothetical protein n=1 Tax=Cryobacterium sp. Y11 TaxID=2045016 RepID=UPI000CE44143|nr:hypothetical protein [Cryobacterium sp. Y11]
MTDGEVDPKSPAGMDARLTNIETILPDLFDMYESRTDAGPYVWAKLPAAESETLWQQLGDFVSWLDARDLATLNDPTLWLLPAGISIPSPWRS